MQKTTYIISLGGSLIIPDQIDWVFLKDFHSLIKKHIHTGKRFVIITGGGKIARNYISAAEEIFPDVSSDDKDWLGIHATRLNAHLVRTIFSDYACPKINTNPYHIEEMSDCSYDILVAAGWKPGFSTDNDAALLAKHLSVKMIINLSNTAFIYEKDPKKYPDAKKITHISWHNYRLMISDHWTPGLNSPFDPIASKLAQEEKMTVVTMDGKNLSNFDLFLEGKDFEGSTIS